MLLIFVVILLASANVQCQLMVSECGQPGPNYVSSRIFGGTNARVDEFPFQVAISRHDQIKVHCGGAMISDRWILTSANCVLFSHVEDLKVSVGIMYGDEIAENSIQVENVWVPPESDFAKSVQKYNIALIKTSKSIKASSKRFVNPICLPFDTSLPKVATFSGFGLESMYTGQQPNQLKTIKLDILSDDQCGDFFDPPSMICADGKTCPGDEGGPFVAKNSNGSYVLHGISTWAYSCTSGKQPTTYTRVSAYLSWISETIANN